MADYITNNFLTVKIHVKEQAATFKRFDVKWTPTLMVLDHDGAVRHRFEGFLPPEDFLSQLHLGLAHAAFAREQWEDAERRYRETVDRFPKADVAPEALYWSGVSRYKATGHPDALGETDRELKQKSPASTWAKKSSPWAA